MISMVYNVTKISMTALMRPAFDAGIALTRLDERIARSPVGAGFLNAIILPTPALPSGSTASSSISKTSFSMTPRGTFAHPPTN